MRMQHHSHLTVGRKGFVRSPLIEMSDLIDLNLSIFRRKPMQIGMSGLRSEVTLDA